MSTVSRTLFWLTACLAGLMLAGCNIGTEKQAAAATAANPAAAQGCDHHQNTRVRARCIEEGGGGVVLVSSSSGLDAKQVANAKTIIQVGDDMKFGCKGKVIALATALQESSLRNLANAAIPASMRRTNEGVGRDHDSVGIFQQRPGWGTLDERMTPRDSARLFYNALAKVPNWPSMAVTRAAQKVQVSAYPDAYAKHVPQAQQLAGCRA